MRAAKSACSMGGDRIRRLGRKRAESEKGTELYIELSMVMVETGVRHGYI